MGGSYGILSHYYSEVDHAMYLMTAIGGTKKGHYFTFSME